MSRAILNRHFAKKNELRSAKRIMVGTFFNLHKESEIIPRSLYTAMDHGSWVCYYQIEQEPIEKVEESRRPYFQKY